MKPRILFVEDHEDTRDMVTTLLGHKGYQVECANNLSAALEMATAEEFDLFVLDYQLDDGNGRELCKKIREFDADTPILFFSASHPQIQADAMECGAQGYVLKPDVAALQTEISRTLSSWQ